jgi:hypothetical protein
VALVEADKTIEQAEVIIVREVCEILDKEEIREILESTRKMRGPTGRENH